MRWYEQIFTLKINKTFEQIIQILKSGNKNISASDYEIRIYKFPAWYRVFAGRGLIKLLPDKEPDQIQTNIQCIISPSFFHFRTFFYFLLIHIPLWGALLFFFPMSPLLLIVFFIDWIIMAFVAIPVLLAAIFISCIYMLYVSFTAITFFFVCLLLALSFLLINAALRYNRGELKKLVIQSL